MQQAVQHRSAWHSSHLQGSLVMCASACGYECRTSNERLAYQRAVTALNFQQQPACVLLLVFPGGGGKSCPHCCVTAVLALLTLAVADLGAGPTSATSEVRRAKGRANPAGRHNKLSEQVCKEVSSRLETACLIARSMVLPRMMNLISSASGRRCRGLLCA